MHVYCVMHIRCVRMALSGNIIKLIDKKLKSLHDPDLNRVSDS